MLARFLGWTVGPAVIVALAAAFLPLSSKAAPDVPGTPHPVAGYERCLTCHGPSGFKPAPANHSNYPESTCLGCHAPSAGPAPAPAAPAPTAPPASPAGPTPVAPTPKPAAPAPTPAAPPAQSGCLSCHGQAGLKMSLGNGEVLPLYVDPQVFAGSIHGGKLLCTDCHSSITGYPHPRVEISSHKSYNIAQYEMCKRCHFANYTKTLDSVHYSVQSGGNLNAPLCTDCHGAHDVSNPGLPRAGMSQTCAGCHDEVYKQYADSVHGKALIEEANFDVPVCTDCHTSHTIEDPRTATFRLKSIQLCSNCHSDGTRMEKYGISTSVVRTYLKDFHGRAAALAGKQGGQLWVEEAVCTDCHGVHAIEKVESPNSPVIKANLLTTCRKCHPDAAENFPSAWLSHYEPSVSKSPLVFFVRWFYRIFIPFVLVGLAVHILLNLWRAVTNR